MSLINHLKAHNKAYSLGFLAIVAVVVAWMFIQSDNLLIQSQMTGDLTKQIPIKMQIRRPLPQFILTSTPSAALQADGKTAIAYLVVGDSITFTATIGQNTAGWNGSHDLDILGANTEALQCQQTSYTATQATRNCTATQNAGNASDSQMAVYAKGDYSKPLSNVITVKVLTASAATSGVPATPTPSTPSTTALPPFCPVPTRLPCPAGQVCAAPAPCGNGMEWIGPDNNGNFACKPPTACAKGEILNCKDNTCASSSTTANPATPVATTGTIYVNQNGSNGVSGTMYVRSQNGSIFVTTTTPNAYEGQPAGDYTLDITSMPKGYLLSTVTDISKKDLQPPYQQTLAPGTVIWYNVTYKPEIK